MSLTLALSDPEGLAFCTLKLNGLVSDDLLHKIVLTLLSLNMITPIYRVTEQVYKMVDCQKKLIYLRKMPVNALIGPKNQETGRGVKVLTLTVDSFDVELVRLKLIF